MKQSVKLMVAISCILAMGYPLWFNINNPELTQMQLLIEFKWLYLICIVILFLIVKSER